MKTLIHAHRGTPELCPENTLEGFAAAMEMEADCIELDVHLSKDGHIIVAHDARLERVSNGTGYINEHTLEALRSLNFNQSHPEMAGSMHAPTLAEVFQLVQDSEIIVNIDLKTTERHYPELPEKLIALVQEYAMQKRVLYSSFNHHSLVQLKKHNQSAKIGLLYQVGLVDPWVYAKYIDADAIHPHYSVIVAHPETVAQCHEYGVAVTVWTVDNPKAIQLMLQYGVDGIITNKLDAAIKCRDSLK